MQFGFGGASDDLVGVSSLALSGGEATATDTKPPKPSEKSKRRKRAWGTGYVTDDAGGGVFYAQKKRDCTKMVHFTNEVGGQSSATQDMFDRSYRDSPHWQKLLTGHIHDGIAHSEEDANVQMPCYIGEFPTGRLAAGTEHGSNCPCYAGMHAWIASQLAAVGVHPIPVHLGIGPPPVDDTGDPHPTDPGCERFRFWWHSHRILATESELADAELFPYATRGDIWEMLQQYFWRQNPGFCPAEDLPLAWRLTPSLWQQDIGQVSLQRTSSTKQADEWHLNRISAQIEKASVAGEPLDGKTTYDIRHLGVIPTGRTVEQVQQTREGRLVTNTPIRILTEMMNMISSTGRDPIGDYTTSRKARSIIMHGWNRWQVLVMLRSFDPVPDEPIVVIDLFAGMGTGALAAVDTPKIVAAPRVLWISIEIDRDAAWLHYNSMAAQVTQDAFEGHLEWLSYCDVENGGFRKEFMVNVADCESDSTEMRSYKAHVQKMVDKLGTAAWWTKAAKINYLLRQTGAPKRNVLILNGSPCDDCSGNNPKRQGVHGARSQLFKYGPLAYKLVKNARI